VLGYLLIRWNALTDTQQEHVYQIIEAFHNGNATQARQAQRNIGKPVITIGAGHEQEGA